MAETPNHGYNVPDPGASDWHEPLNENFEQYDTDVEIRGPDGERGDYDPKAGAKYLATDTGAVYLGDGSTWNALPTAGPSPSLAELTVEGESNGSVATVTNTSTADRTTHGLRGECNSPGPASFGVVRRSRASSGFTFGLGGFSDSPDGGGVYGFTDEGGVGVFARARGGGLGVFCEGDASVTGDLEVSGTKNFVQSVDTDDGPREVVYTAVESGTPHTEATGVARLEDGRAAVDLPDHFAMVTSDEDPLAVQVTPHARDPVRPQVVERSTHRIVVEDVEDPTRSYEVSYTVTGTREGFADRPVVRDPAEE